MTDFPNRMVRLLGFANKAEAGDEPQHDLGEQVSWTGHLGGCEWRVIGNMRRPPPNRRRSHHEKTPRRAEPGAAVQGA
jgi:hypothetical protein